MLRGSVLSLLTATHDPCYCNGDQVSGGKSVGNGFKKDAWPDRSIHDNAEHVPNPSGIVGRGKVYTRSG
jgi:hypothetical protein